VERPETRQRFIQVCLALKQTLGEALTGSQSRAALEILDREEANCPTAVRWALADDLHQAAGALGDTFREYLKDPVTSASEMPGGSGSGTR
jgi:Arc/MetJ family transcription regulator